MRIRIEQYTQAPIYLEYSEAIAQRFLDDIEKFQKRYEADPELFVRKYRKFRKDATEDARRLRAESNGSGKAEEWVERVRGKRKMKPDYWTQKRLAALVVKTEDEVARALSG